MAVFFHMPHQPNTETNALASSSNTQHKLCALYRESNRPQLHDYINLLHKNAANKRSPSRYELSRTERGKQHYSSNVYSNPCSIHHLLRLFEIYPICYKYLWLILRNLVLSMVVCDFPSYCTK